MRLRWRTRPCSATPQSLRGVFVGCDKGRASPDVPVVDDVEEPVGGVPVAIGRSARHRAGGRPRGRRGSTPHGWRAQIVDEGRDCGGERLVAVLHGLCDHCGEVGLTATAVPGGDEVAALRLAAIRTPLRHLVFPNPPSEGISSS